MDVTNISNTLQANTASIGAITCVIATSDTNAKTIPGHHGWRFGHAPSARHCCCGDDR